jgi:hypothetical protein
MSSLQQILFQVLSGSEGVGGEGGSAGRMTHTMYAHINKCIKYKRNKERDHAVCRKMDETGDDHVL